MEPKFKVSVYLSKRLRRQGQSLSVTSIYLRKRHFLLTNQLLLALSLPYRLRVFGAELYSA
jgi:hypothetical protein